MRFDAEARRAARPTIVYDESLPVTLRREEIAAAILQHQVVIICGETGSGKTTQLPKICLELGRGVAGLIGHTQPRRIAARTVASRIAQELNSPRWASRSATRCVSTTRSARAQPHQADDRRHSAGRDANRPLLLNAYDTIIIDEAHERSLNIDFLLGYLKQLLPAGRI
jgi:ATP-dependent helicase HrpA